MNTRAVQLGQHSDRFSAVPASGSEDNSLRNDCMGIAALIYKKAIDNDDRPRMRALMLC